MIEVIPGNITHAAIMAEIHGAASPDPWPLSAYAESLKNPSTHSLLVLEEGTPRGFVLVQQAADEAEILMIAVNPSFQGKNYGKHLVVSIAEQLEQKGVKALFLEVAEDNAPARSLYAKCGFAQVGRRKGYYAHANARRQPVKVDALLMRLDIVETDR